MSTLDQAYEALTSDDDGRVCRDIPDSACDEQPRNFFVHVASLAASKSGDGLADAKLVLSWLLTQAGAPAAAVGLLVPVREAGALLPQLGIAAWVRSRPRRKFVWAAGSAVQGLAVLAMGAAALTLEGASLGWTIVGLLAVAALARSFCSVAYKDVLGKTVSKATRGTATGTASTVAAAVTLAFGASLAFGVVPVTVPWIAGFLFAAGAAWLLAALLFVTLHEVPGATEGGGNPIEVIREQASLLRRDPQLVRFIATRGLLTATALAPPYLLAIGAVESTQKLSSLGPFVLASSAAGLTSTYVWGRLADRSSRRVLMRSGVLAAIPLAAAGAIGLAGSEAMRQPLVLAALLFAIQIAYQGVRLGRSTHVVDMAGPETRAAYTALSNSIVGLLLVAAGVFGLVAQWTGPGGVLALFAAMCVGAAFTARGLDEVQSS